MRLTAAPFWLPASLLALAPFALAACDSLTAPPEPITVDTTTAAAASAKPQPRPSASASAPAPAASPTPPAPPPDANAKLQIIDEVVGKGPAAKAGDTLSVHYVGTLTDGGKEFDSSRKRGKPFVFVLGRHAVIEGWDQGMVGMKVGGKRKLIIPSAMGYGARGAGADIPPNAGLTFEVELLDIKK